MSTRRTKPYHHGDLRRALISAGMALLAEEGATALDLRKVARKAGVSHAAPYRHFEDKRELLAAIAEEGFMKLTEQISAAVSASAPETRLLALAHAYIGFALSEPALAREMFSGLTIDRMAYPSLHAASKVAFNLLLDVVQAQQAAGYLVQDDPEKLVLVIWSMIHGLAMLLLENQLPHAAEDLGTVAEITRQYVDCLYNGLRPH